MTTNLNKGETMMTTMRSPGHASLMRLILQLAVVTVLATFLLPISAKADLIHNSTDTGSTKWASQGGWGVAGGKYGQFTCATCHEPDADNLKNIRRTINTMNGGNWPNGTPANTVYFLNQTSMGDDSVARTSSNRICEVCHSQNRFHNYSTTSNLSHGGALNHPTPKAVCTSCHSHNTGFKAACGGCHGNPPTTANIGGDYGLIGTPHASNALPPGAPGAHVTHVQTRAMVCETCHYINNGTTKMPNQSGTIQIGFFGFGGKVTSGTYGPYSSAAPHYRFASGTANTTIAAAVISYATANKCSNVYCHGGGLTVSGSVVKVPLTAQNPATLNQTPQWNGTGQNQCGNCHGKDAANPPTMGSHVKHAAATGGYSFSCDMCHPNNADNSHVQGNVRWQLQTGNAKVGAAATYQAAGAPSGLATGSTGDLAPSASYGQCSNINCHKDGKGGAGLVATPTWGASLPASCAGCHGGLAASGTPLATGRHSAHINNAATIGSNYTCGDCHAKTATGNAISSTINHVNLFMDYSAPKAGKGSTYSTSTGICSATYCHTDGKGTQKMVAANNWSAGAALGCNGCHGADSAAGSFASVAGEPNYSNAGSGVTKANSHQKHVSTIGASTCVGCHGTTVNGGGTAIASGATTHSDKVIDVVAGGGKAFTWASGTKQCSNISCHGTGAAAAIWGATLSCTGCHGGNAGSGTPLATGKHAAHINQSAVIGTNFGCVDCHAKTVTSDTTVGTPVNHTNGFADYSGVKAGKSSTYSSATGVCSATYCHTDGKGTQKLVAANNWKTGTALGCNGCHGADSAAGSFASVAGEPNYSNFGSGQTKANSHLKHVGASGAATCTYCHGTTVTAAGTAIAPSATTHTNQALDVVQGGGKTFTFVSGSKQCSNISCHGAGSPAANWGATLPADCTGCHAGNTGAATIISTGKHAAHVNNAAVIGTNFGCADCHGKTVSADRTISNTTMHGNSFVDYSGVKAGRSTTYSSATGVCSASYCHSDGKGAQKMAAANNWTAGAALGCNGCHGADSVAGSFASVAGEPNYSNAGSGAARANSHQKHVSTSGASTCVNCHVTTVVTAGTAIIGGATTHANSTIDVAAGGGKSFTWTPAGKTCSSISCHGGGNATWGDASAGCQGCHGTLSSGHGKHIGDLITGNNVSFYNFTANRSDASGSVYRYGCANCHPTDVGMHQNSTIDVTLNKNKTGGSYLNSLNNLVTTDTGGYTRGGANNLTCETVYCHSNGKKLALTAPDYKQTPNWYGGAFGANRCGSCHDNPPQYVGDVNSPNSHYVASSSIGNNGTPPYRETGHMIGIHSMNTYVGNKANGFLGFSSSSNKAHGNPALATTITCYICHSGTVSSSQTDTYAMNGTSSDFRCGACHTASTRTRLQTGVIGGAGRHINGAKDVAFAPISFLTKAQLGNVANALGWTRNGTFKAADSYDSFDLSVATWNPGTRTCLTACHVNQPNITWGAQLTCKSCHANQ
jgi:predicted CxxxxCH...CXXCH cytochrome family protein